MPTDARPAGAICPAHFQPLAAPSALAWAALQRMAKEQGLAEDGDDGLARARDVAAFSTLASLVETSCGGSDAFLTLASSAVWRADWAVAAGSLGTLGAAAAFIADVVIPSDLPGFSAAALESDEGLALVLGGGPGGAVARLIAGWAWNAVGSRRKPLRRRVAERDGSILLLLGEPRTPMQAPRLAPSAQRAAATRQGAELLALMSREALFLRALRSSIESLQALERAPTTRSICEILCAATGADSVALRLAAVPDSSDASARAEGVRFPLSHRERAFGWLSVVGEPAALVVQTILPALSNALRVWSARNLRGRLQGSPEGHLLDLLLANERAKGIAGATGRPIHWVNQRASALYRLLRARENSSFNSSSRSR